ncbi:MAG: alpha/beta hydrolase-fold protein [Nibricoccus sp.]
MKTTRLMLSAVLFATSFAFDASSAEPNSAPSYQPHTLPNSQLRVLPKNANGRQYQLHVGLPPNYSKGANKRYPVVYVTDGYWDFEKIDAIRGGLLYDRYVPEFIIVGIGYPGQDVDYGSMRRWELSPCTLDNDPQNTGHAADFLKSIETDIIPYIDREFRTDPTQRVLGGASLGGLFTLYAMYTKPELFSGYMAITPAVSVADEWLLGYEEKFVKAGGKLKGRLFVSVGQNEWPNFVASIFRYNSRVSWRKYPALAYQFRVIEGARHAGMQMESYVRALTFVFAPLAPESGPLRDM